MMFNDDKIEVLEKKVRELEYITKFYYGGNNTTSINHILYLILHHLNLSVNYNPGEVTLKKGEKDVKA